MLAAVCTNSTAQGGFSHAGHKQYSVRFELVLLLCLPTTPSVVRPGSLCVAEAQGAVYTESRCSQQQATCAIIAMPISGSSAGTVYVSGRGDQWALKQACAGRHIHTLASCRHKGSSQ